MNSNSLLLVLFLFTSFSFSQEFSSPNPSVYGKISRNADLFNPRGGLNIKQNNGNETSSIKGTKYLFPVWDGNYIIESIQGIRYNLNSLNYNLDTKKLESLLSRDSIFELRSNQVDFILANNKRFKIINEELFQELNNGKFKIYKQFNVKVKDAFINPLTRQEAAPAEYVQFGKYFYFNNDVLTPFKLSKKEVLNMLKDKQQQVNKYAKDKNFSFSDEDDVIKIVNYYNTL